MFTHLHVHTENSMLDGLSRIDQMIAKAKELGMDSLAITDHGVLYGAIDFYKSAVSAGIKPIIGCEMYVAQNSRHEKNPQYKKPYHLTVLAKNITGYQNLVKLVSLSHLEGFYYKPRVDRELLENYSEGLIVLSGCPSSEVSTLIVENRLDEARNTAHWYKNNFQNYYFELMDHANVDNLDKINQKLIELSSEMDIPLVATNDCHYVNKEDSYAQDILICIHTNTNILDEKRMKMDDDSYYLKSHDEMSEMYAKYPEAIANTQKIAEMCDLEIDFDQMHLPEFEVPNGLNADEYLNQICFSALKTFNLENDHHKSRLEYELEVIKQTSFANYFLVVWDIAKFVRDNHIFFAVRGSAAASLTLYCLGVTDINPLDYNLVFERFLNLERKDMPDIDMDFQDDRREEVLNYVVEKYGSDHVAQIITFGTMGAKAAIRDVGRALAIPYSDVDVIAKYIPNRLNISITESLSESSELSYSYQSDSKVKNLIDTAISLEGLKRHSSTHAAGVLISKKELDKLIPLQRPTKDTEHKVAMTQFAMDPIASLGLLKMDFLGLSNLTILSNVQKQISIEKNIDIKLQDIPLYDKPTFDLLGNGETAGVFQLEGSGMTRYIKELKPTSLGDIAAMIALYRPGPMEHIDTFISAKHGHIEPEYPHEALKEILEETYGVIVFQDQVLLIAQAFAGYTLGEADIVRKAMGKKIPGIMATEREKFIGGALSHGYSNELAEKIFDLIEPFAGYAFNKAHSVSYGLISYWTAYMKANYTVEYMVALLNAYIDNMDRVRSAIVECRRLGIKVLPPDINFSNSKFSIFRTSEDKQGIRFGLSAIKNVGDLAIDSFLIARNKYGKFGSLEEMCREGDMSGINRKNLESLIKSGSMDEFGHRGALLDSIDRILSLAQSELKLKNSNQSSMFDLFGESVSVPLSKIDLPLSTISDHEQLLWEVEMLGISLSSKNPLNLLINKADSEMIVFLNQISDIPQGKKVNLAGQISSVIHRRTKNDKPFLIVSLALLDGSIDVFVWEELMNESMRFWTVGNLVNILGTLKFRNEDVTLHATFVSRYNLEDDSSSSLEDNDFVSVEPLFEPTINPETILGVNTIKGIGKQNGNHLSKIEDKQEMKKLNITLIETDSVKNDEDRFNEVKDLLLGHNGDDEVILKIISGQEIIKMSWPMMKINISDNLKNNLENILGDKGSIKVENIN